MSGAARVAIVVGSVRDREHLAGAFALLDQLGIAYEFRALSAHRDPEGLAAFIREFDARGVRVVIAAAGIAAHLAGAVASRSLLPVIGVPLVASPLGGIDALLSTLQMPAGLPVATVGVGKEGPANAAFLAAEILALSDPSIAPRLAAHREALRARGRGDGAA
jgi:phosphoribosylaminoimidazole carboxylase PurE protein